MTAVLDAPAEVGAIPSFTVTLRVMRYLPGDDGTTPVAHWDEFQVLCHGTDRVLTPCTRSNGSRTAR